MGRIENRSDNKMDCIAVVVLNGVQRFLRMESLLQRGTARAITLNYDSKSNDTANGTIEVA